MVSVYDRIRKLSTSQSLQERMMIPYTAILNLTDKDEIRAFTEEYIKLFEGTGKEDVRYMLSFFDIEDRKLWKEAIGDLFHIDVLFNRPERELYRYFDYVDGKGNVVEYQNKEKGLHQDIQHIGCAIYKSSFSTVSE